MWDLVGFSGKEVRNMMPKCCGKRMDYVLETAKYIEAWCGVCGDRVFIKKQEIKMPQMLDD